MKELERLLKSAGLAQGGNPVAAWMADSLEAKHPTDDPDRVRPVKPDRGKTGKRIDGMVSLILAIDGRLTVDEADALPAADIF
jgi:phage terminase large subunit-like protein